MTTPPKSTTRRKTTRKQTPEGPNLDVRITMRLDGAVEIDPQFNKPMITHLDTLYTMANREDYDQEWTDDHKLAFFLADIIEQVLSQWGTPSDPDELDPQVSAMPHITESPVKDVLDLSRMTVAKSSKRPN